ncbi:glutathione S-transferase U8-like [Asparagus officinalis]|uniref:glutathione S-transferase U8-like n=1 Tax=Asparagus officinalis TaxID=4686 RepID=UPI00098E3A41|nr:glutathione S-transferase U8-like [Asparagus officinalis]
MSEEVKLLGVWGSPFSRRVELALRLKGVPYDYIEEDLLNKSSLLLESNPVCKQVPVLIHGEKTVVESLIIIEYIEDTWSTAYSLLRKDPIERAQARFLTKFIDEKCLPAVWRSCWSQGEAQKNFMEESKKNLRILEDELKGKKFFGGESIGLPDLAANFLTIWTDVLQEIAGICVTSEEKHPILWNWSQEFLKCDAVGKCTPDRQNLLAMFQAQKGAKMNKSP